MRRRIDDWGEKDTWVCVLEVKVGGMTREGKVSLQEGFRKLLEKSYLLDIVSRYRRVGGNRCKLGESCG